MALANVMPWAFQGVETRLVVGVGSADMDQ